MTICPEAASTPERSATAGGTDSAVKKESWLTQPTVGQVAHTRLQAGGAAAVCRGEKESETPRRARWAGLRGGFR